MTPLWEPVDGWLDRIVRPELLLFGQPRSSFRVCGLAGIVFAAVIALALVAFRGYSLAVMALLVAAALLTFLLLAFATTALTGVERLVYLHHQIAAVGVATLVLWALRQPILPYLDPMMLGLVALLVFGRVGCLMAGCCHGRPFPRGVRYRAAHAAAGFTPYYVGVPLFPVQLVEAVLAAAIVVVGCGLIASRAAPGVVLAWTVILYGVGRFCGEFARGDPERSYLWGFSEAQWTALALAWVIVILEWHEVLVVSSWHAAAAAGLTTAIVAVALHRRFREPATHRLLHPRHVREVATAVHRASQVAESGPVAIDLSRTSLGIQISVTRAKQADSQAVHYALSSRDGTMSEQTAITLAGLIEQLDHHVTPLKVAPGRVGIYHLVAASTLRDD